MIEDSSKAVGIDNIEGRLFRDCSSPSGSNYRKIVHSQTLEFLDSNNIIYKFQSGFRETLCGTCFSYLSDKILPAFDKGLFIGY